MPLPPTSSTSESELTTRVAYRRGLVYLDPGKLLHELHIRLLTIRELTRLADVAEHTVRRAIRGDAITRDSARRILGALRDREPLPASLADVIAE